MIKKALRAIANRAISNTWLIARDVNLHTRNNRGEVTSKGVAMTATRVLGPLVLVIGGSALAESMYGIKGVAAVMTTAWLYLVYSNIAMAGKTNQATRWLLSWAFATACIVTISAGILTVLGGKAFVIAVLATCVVLIFTKMK